MYGFPLILAENLVVEFDYDRRADTCFQVVETTDMLVELKVPATDVIQLYLETAHVTLQADIDAGMSFISI